MITTLLLTALLSTPAPAPVETSPLLGRLAQPVRTATVFGVPTAYYEAGDGPPVILLAALGWDASSFWFRNVPALARNHHVIALDLVGLGESGKPMLDYTMRTWTEWIAEFLRVKGIPRATIAGIEMGGALAVQFAIDFPDKCAGIVFAATNSGPGHPGVAPGHVSSSLAAIRASLERQVADKTLVDDTLVRARFEMRLRSNEGYAMERHLSDHRAPYSEDELAHVTAPALVVWCDADAVTPLDWGRAYAAALRGSQLVVLHGCGHLANLEQPEGFNAAVAAFLAAHAREAR